MRRPRPYPARRLDLSAALARLHRVEPRFQRLARRHGPPPLRPSRNHFRSLARSIVYQQLSGAAAGRIVQRLRERFPETAFPTPEQLLGASRESLARAGLSRQKIAALRDLAAHWSDGRLSARRLRGLDDERIVASLIRVRGVGPWTADMFLIFALNRPDILPVGDLGIRKGFQAFFDLESLPDAATMESLAGPWRPYRSVASWYLWRVAENGLPSG